MRKHELDGPDVFVVHDFLTPPECAAHVPRAEAAGFDAAPVMAGLGPVVNKETRNNDRVMVDDPDLAAALCERARPLLPARLRNFELVGLNERFRYYRYDPGQRFAPHFDGAFYRTDDEQSWLTFMVYLNDGFSGGETNFYRRGGAPSLGVIPQAGMALVFVHATLHEGAPVEAGRKYVLRTDVMYRRAE